MRITSAIFSLLLIQQIFAKDDLSLRRGNGNINQDRRSLQKEGNRCGTPDLSPEEREKVDPAVRAWIKEHDPVRFGSQEKIQIRTVFHIIQGTNGAGALTIENVKDSIDVINAAFSGFEFILDYDKDLTTTTNNAWGELDSGTQAENDMKSTLRKGSCDVLNIYSTSLDWLLGWATFPNWCDNDQNDDGVVIGSETYPGGDFFPYDEGDTLTHEVGHWLGLYHTFEGGCNGGDEVDDTPDEATKNEGVCKPDRDTCPSPGNDPTDNFMDYSDDSCMDKFTPGQDERMLTMWALYRSVDQCTMKMRERVCFDCK